MPLSRSGRLGVVLFFGALLGSTAFAYAQPVEESSDNSVTNVVIVPIERGERETATTQSHQPDPEAPAPLPPASTDVGFDPLAISATGDVVFDREYLPVFNGRGFDHAFEGVGDLFLRDDLTIVNLECTPSTLGDPVEKAFVFRCPVSALAVARQFGVDVVNLANNHSQDFGTAALLDGVLQSRLAGLSPVGVGSDVEAATKPALFEVGGRTVAVLGMGGVIPGAHWLARADHPGMASGDDLEQMIASVAAASKVADFVFVTIHWGEEGVTEPRADDRERVRAMIAAGADAIFGHHPHRLGELELVDGVPVFWTLGNFIWPRLSDASANTAVARLEIDEAGKVTACLLPAFIEINGQPRLTGPTDCSP